MGRSQIDASWENARCEEEWKVDRREVGREEGPSLLIKVVCGRSVCVLLLHVTIGFKVHSVRLS